MERRLLGLDALRGIAASLVVLQHLLWFLGDEGVRAAGAALELFDFGKLGVALFFMTSGYVIPLSFKHGFRQFVIGRAARLLPVLWLSIALMLAFRSTEGTYFSIPTVVANMVMVAEPLGFELVELLYWTLQWELGFYILCATLFAMGRLRDPTAISIVAFASVCASFLVPEMIWLSLMLGGSLVALKSWRALALLGILGGLSVSVWFVEGTLPRATLLALWLAPPLFMAFPSISPSRSLVFVGTISYSLYLLHFLVLALAWKADLAPLELVVVGIVGSVALSTLTFYCVERPFMALARRARAGTPRIAVA